MSRRYRPWDAAVRYIEGFVIFGGLVALAALGEYVCGLTW